MENDDKWKSRELVAAGLIAFISASLIFAEIFLYVYIRIAWELHLVIAIIMLIGAFLGFGNRWGGVILVIEGGLLLILGLLYGITQNPTFYIYSPWYFLRDIGVSLEGILSIISGILIIDGHRR